GAVHRLTRHRDVRVGGQDVDQQPPGGGRIVDDQDAWHAGPQISRRTASRRPFRLNVLFTMYASAPTSTPRARSSDESSDVTRMTGKSRNRGSARRRAVNCRPSKPGMFTS